VSGALVILAVGALVATSCALVGSFLVLRKMSLLGDAISHAVLPGIVIAFLMTGDRSSLPMLLGAAAFGLLTVFLVELFHQTRRLQEDASIGVVFPALFSLGVILLSRYAYQVDLDLECVLYGEIAFAPLDVVSFGGLFEGPRALFVTGTVLAINVVVIALFYKELKVCTFDPELAHSLGFSPRVMHYVLMSLVSLTTVGSFESVGAILVVAMLVAPAATAYLLTDRLAPMLALAVAIGIAAAWSGYAIAHWLDASIAGAMASVAGLIFLLALLLSPRHGVVARIVRARRLAARIAETLLLSHLDTRGPGVPAAELGRRFGWDAERTHRTVDRLRRRRQIDGDPAAGLVLTDAGARFLEASELPRDLR
jgi:manganese/zinc/iron transport system permease protein